MDNTQIAVASSDGIVVNNHFGKARKFYIYKVNDEVIDLQEIRELKPVCDTGNHDDERLRENLNELIDCEYLLVSRIGDGARNMALGMGIEAFEIPGIIKDSIDQLIKYVKIQKLFE